MNLNITNNPFYAKFSNEKTMKFCIYLVYAIFFFWRHFHLEYVGDDLIMGPGVDSYSLWENFVWHWGYNGRIVTDVFANIWYRFPSMWWWKVFDSILYIIAAMLISRIFTKNTWKHVLVVCGLILLFPFDYMMSAGYIATSANYFYPFIGALVVVRVIKYVLEDQKIPVYMYFATAISIIYTTNQDQTAIALLAGLLFYLIYCNYTKAEARLRKTTLWLFVSTLVMYIAYFLLPGHLGRMSSDSTDEMDMWFPEYADWTFGDKVFHGYTSTVANLFYNDILIFMVFAAILMILSFRQKCPIRIFIGCIPFVGVALSNFMQKGQFIYYFERSIGMPELMPIGVFAFPFILSVIMLVSIFAAIWLNVEKMENKLFLTLLLLLGAGTREMMGFTATIYLLSCYVKRIRGKRRNQTSLVYGRWYNRCITDSLLNESELSYGNDKNITIKVQRRNPLSCIWCINHCN